MYTNWNWYDGNFGHGEDDDFNQLSSGPCCSSWGECGSGVDFCGSGCQEAFSASFPGYYWEPMSACGQKETFFGPWIELQYPGVPGTPDHDVFEFEIYEASFSNGIFVSMCNCYSYYDDRDNRIQLLDKDDNELEYFIGGCWDDSCPQGGYVPQLYPDDDFEGFNTYKIKHICYPTYDWDGQTDAYCEGSTTVVIFEVMEIEEWYVGNAGESCYTVCNKVGKSCNGNWWVSWPKNCEDIYYIAANAVNGPIHCDRCRQGSDDDIYANPEIVYYGDQWGGNTHSDGSICFYRKYDTNRCDYYQEQSDDWWSHREAGYRFCPCWYYD
jgi:hypothetical protein